MKPPGPIEKLVRELSRLPGIGAKSANRLAYHLLKVTRTEAEELARSIIEVKDKIVSCRQCNQTTDRDPCDLCTDSERSSELLCVVEESINIGVIERSREFRGRYHVLGGALSPLRGIGPEDIDVRGLLDRLAGTSVTEVIVATNPNVEGEATALYLAKQIKPLGIKVSRIAFGLPVGGDLEFADEATVSRSLSGRQIM